MIPPGNSESTPTLVLITESYPLGGSGEDVFIEPEIGFLAARFQRVIIVPVLDFGKTGILPENIIVERSFLKRPGLYSKFKSLFHRETYKALFNDLRRIKSLSDLRSDMAFSAYTLYYSNLINALIAKYGLKPGTALFYTFWFDYATAALAFSAKGFRFITRAHGQDLYEETKPFISRYWREKTFGRLTGCYTVSKYSANYLRNLYPDFSEKIHCRYLGTKMPERLNPEIPDKETVNLFSCARVSPEKRVLYLCKVIKEYAARHPELIIRWLHIGDGPDMEKLKRETKKSPKNLKIELTGRIENKEVRNSLATNHFDLALLLSSTEGLGVAICEAMSFGVPVLATDIQAIPEAVGEVGFLMPLTDDVNKGADILNKALNVAHSRRRASREHWERHFNAESLRHSFADEIRHLLEK